MTAGQRADGLGTTPRRRVEMLTRYLNRQSISEPRDFWSGCRGILGTVESILLDPVRTSTSLYSVLFIVWLANLSGTWASSDAFGLAALGLACMLALSVQKRLPQSHLLTTVPLRRSDATQSLLRIAGYRLVICSLGISLILLLLERQDLMASSALALRHGLMLLSTLTTVACFGILWLIAGPAVGSTLSALAPHRRGSILIQGLILLSCRAALATPGPGEEQVPLWFFALPTVLLVWLTSVALRRHLAAADRYDVAHHPDSKMAWSSHGVMGGLAGVWLMSSIYDHLSWFSLLVIVSTFAGLAWYLWQGIEFPSIRGRLGLEAVALAGLGTYQWLAHLGSLDARSVVAMQMLTVAVWLIVQSLEGQGTDELRLPRSAVSLRLGDGLRSLMASGARGMSASARSAAERAVSHQPKRPPTPEERFDYVRRSIRARNRALPGASIISFGGWVAGAILAGVLIEPGMPIWGFDALLIFYIAAAVLAGASKPPAVSLLKTLPIRSDDVLRGLFFSCLRSGAIVGGLVWVFGWAVQLTAASGRLEDMVPVIWQGLGHGVVGLSALVFLSASCDAKRSATLGEVFFRQSILLTLGYLALVCRWTALESPTLAAHRATILNGLALALLVGLALGEWYIMWHRTSKQWLFPRTGSSPPAEKVSKVTTPKTLMVASMCMFVPLGLNAMLAFHGEALAMWRWVIGQRREGRYGKGPISGAAIVFCGLAVMALVFKRELWVLHQLAIFGEPMGTFEYLSFLLGILFVWIVIELLPQPRRESGGKMLGQ